MTIYYLIPDAGGGGRPDLLQYYIRGLFKVFFFLQYFNFEMKWKVIILFGIM